MVIVPKIRGFICVTAHPEGCAAHVQQQIDHVTAQGAIPGAPKRVLIIGSSTGYGLSSRITAAFGGGAATMGIFFEKAAEGGKLGTAGWYNSVAFELAARDAGLYARSFNGDAFGDEMKAAVVEAIKADWGQVDQVIYSLASPRRANPRTGEVFRSCLKPIDQVYTSKTLLTDKEEVIEISIEPATEQDVSDTINVMGGEDWQWWIDALEQGGVLAPGAQTVAYSYIGPELTYPIYRNGTIGIAKEDLEKTAHTLHARLAKSIGGSAYVSVNKALVTQASSAIPVVPLYISALYKVMKEAGTHEGCIEQIQRLYATQLFNEGGPSLDEKGRIRMDDWEMKPEIQSAVANIWDNVATENLKETTDFSNYQTEFLKLFGFGLPGVDYAAESDPNAIAGRPAVI